MVFDVENSRFNFRFGYPTVNESSAANLRIHNVTTTGFQVLVDEEEAADRIHALESIHWIAVEPGAETYEGITFETVLFNRSLTHQWQTWNFLNSFDSPAFLSHLQSRHGGDTSALRYQNLNSSTVQVKIEEERSANNEVGHTSEIAGYIIFEEAE